MTRVYCVYRARHRDQAFTGHGARRHGARWNLPGTPMVYTSATISLCLLELFVHLDPEVVDLAALDLEFRWADLPDSVSIFERATADLPVDWRDLPWPASTQRAGSAWMADGRDVVAVPSVVVPTEQNYLLNPMSSSFPSVRIGPPARLELDRRLFGRQRPVHVHHR